jgi:hypothetical protein
VVVLVMATTVVVDSAQPSAPAILGGVFGLAGFDFALLLPFLILSWTNALYRARLERMLGLEASELAGGEHPVSKPECADIS